MKNDEFDETMTIAQKQLSAAIRRAEIAEARVATELTAAEKLAEKLGSPEDVPPMTAERLLAELRFRGHRILWLEERLRRIDIAVREGLHQGPTRESLDEIASGLRDEPEICSECVGEVDPETGRCSCPAEGDGEEIPR